LASAFSIGLLLGPAAAEHFGVPTLFWLTALLSLIAIPLLWLGLPSPPRRQHHEDVEISREHVMSVLRNKQLLRLDFGTLNLHMSLTAMFVTLPILIQKIVPLGHQWRFFLPLLVVGMLSMLLGARLSDRPRGPRRVLRVGQLLLIGGLVLFAFAVPPSIQEPQTRVGHLAAGLILFIAGFALLELLLPALLTRHSDAHNRGTAAGVFNMSQFCGAFLGGIVAGAFLKRDLEALYWVLAGTSVLWFIAAQRLREPSPSVRFSEPARE
ncbi:MAG TPA: MFS transporter, partial [Candidatus Eisenbacteria bacterium]|nr:MFS transporter [Candidatus Eisenbacteria bacterium]